MGGLRVLGLCRLDRLPYLDGLRLMEALADMRRAGEVPDCLLHVQHPPVYTIGKRGVEDDLLVGREELARLGAEVHNIPRGGEVTFHGPGQAVLYPVADLRELGVGARRFVEGLEDCMIDTAALHGIRAQGRLKGSTGVWVGEPEPTRKIGAIGVRISRGVSTHGLAMNICPDLSYFRHIIPCGAVGKDVTSVQREVGGGEVDYGLVSGQLVEMFARQFGYGDVREIDDVVGRLLGD